VSSESDKTIKDLQLRLERKEREMHSIQQIGKTLSSVLNRDRLLILIMNEVTRLIGAERGTLYIVDAEKGELWSKIAQKAEIKEIRLKIGTGISGFVAKTGEIINIRDAYKDKRFDPTTDKKTGFSTNSILCMPIREPVKEEGQEGEIIAVLQILNKVDGYFTIEDEDLLTSLGSQIAISLVNSRLYSILEDRLNELNLLFNLEKELSKGEDSAKILKNLLKMMTDSLNAEHGILLLTEKDGEEFSYRGAVNIDEEMIGKIEIPRDKGAIGYVFDKIKTYVTNDAKSDKIINHLFLKKCKINAKQVVCTALKGDNKCIGVIELLNKKGENSYFSENDIKIIESIAGQISRGIENIRLREEKMKADRLATVGNMMSTIVHDLRTPMNNIYGFVDLMLEEDERDTREEYAEIVNEQIKILTNMTTDILDFSKGKTTILPIKHPVDKLIKDFVKFFETDIKKRGFKFEYAINISSMVYVDPEKIGRVFMNIMKNALEAMDKGGTFRIEASQENGEVKFSLSDTGGGIPEEIRDKLFDSFVTSGKEGGTGLGLAIVKKVIDEHKGRIEVESETGIGTTFNIYFKKA
jgi:K+-sensing histidine kinase KdpD